MASDGPWAKWADKYFIDEETLESSRVAVSEGWKPFSSLSLLEARRQGTCANVVSPGVVTYDGLIKDHMIPAAHLEEGVLVTVYKPTDLPATPLIVLYCHGGGLVLGRPLTFDPCVKQLAMTLKAIVASIDYRLLPCADDPLAPFNDCIAVTEWVIKNKEAVGGHRDSKIAVVGGSAGGQICSGLTYSIKSGIDFQVMAYPVVDVKCDTESFKEFYTNPGLSTVSMEKMIEVAGIGTESMAKNPVVNPMVRDDLHTCPPTLMLVAALDPLRDGAIQFAEKLRAAGVDVEEVIVDGVAHGFFDSVKRYPKKSKEAHNVLKRFLEARM